MDPLDPRGPNIGGPDPLNPPVDAPIKQIIHITI